MSVIKAATFAYRITAEGAEKVQKSISGIGRGAKTEFNAASKSTRDFNKDLRDTVGELKKLEGAARGLKNLRNAVISLAGAGGIAYLVKSSLQAADNIGDMAAKAGIGVEQFQELEFALRRFSVTQLTAVNGMRELNVRATEFFRDGAGSAKSAFEQLGFSREAVGEGMKSADRFFENVLDRIGQIESEAEKIELLSKIFGQGASGELINAVNAGTEALRAARQEARDLNYVIGEDMVKAAADANKRIEVLGDVLKRQLVIAVARNADEIERFMNTMIEGLPKAIALLERTLKLFGLVEKSAEEKLARAYKHAEMANLAAENAVNAPRGRSGTRAFRRSPIIGTAADSQMEVYRLEQQVMAEAMARQDREKRMAEYLAQFDTRFGATGSAQNNAVETFNAARDANQELIKSMQFEIEIMKLSEREQAVARAIRRLSADATDYQRQQVESLAGALYDEQQELKRLMEVEQEAIRKKEELKKEARDFANTLASGFEDAIVQGKKLNDVLDEMLTYIAKIAIRKSFTDPFTEFVTSAFEGIDFGGAFGFGSAPGRAAGGTVYAGQLYRVNERPGVIEGFRPSSGGQVIPLGAAAGGGGVNVTIINNTPAQVTPVMGQRGDGMEELRIQIDQEMANNVSNPFSRTHAALKNYSSSPAIRR